MNGGFLEWAKIFVPAIVAVIGALQAPKVVSRIRGVEEKEKSQFELDLEDVRKWRQRRDLEYDDLVTEHEDVKRQLREQKRKTEQLEYQMIELTDDLNDLRREKELDLREIERLQRVNTQLMEKLLEIERHS